jgi:glycosyltransferase involved in cell wall biosynthesis
MKISVLINNYNYARFLPEAVASAANQTFPASEIIVIDDGSTDESLLILESLRTTHPNLIVHTQPNSGQLAAMRKGIHLACGDWCAFLDADDTWEPNHLAALIHTLERDNDIGAYYSGHKETQGPKAFRSKWTEGAVGPAAALVALTGTRIGTITSTLILRRQFAKLVAELPSSFDDDWKTRADDCLIFGCCLAGAIVYYNPLASVTYRIHGENCFAGNKQTIYEEYRYNLKKRRMMAYYENRFGLDRYTLHKLLATEYCRHFRNQSSRRANKLFTKAILRSDTPTFKKLRILSASLFKRATF